MATITACGGAPCTVRCLLPIVLFGLAHGAGHAQSSLDPGCTAPEHRQFDFWVGAWTVTDSAGVVLGTNDVTRIAGGCGLREHWRGARGAEGMSLNVWQPALERWTQFWVGADVVLSLFGALDGDGRMVLEGERQLPDGPLLDRIIWTPLPAGEVRQEWNVSRDGGLSWQRTFSGIYRPRDAGASAMADRDAPADGKCLGHVARRVHGCPTLDAAAIPAVTRTSP